MLKNTENSYGLISRIFHWAMSILIVVMLSIGFIMVNIESNEQKSQIYNAHKATGLVILLLIFLRTIWTISNIKVQAPFDIPEWQRKLANLNHKLFYYLMFIMPISGALMSLLGGHDISFFGLFTLKSFMQNKNISKIFLTIHLYTAFLLVGTIILHVAAALYHHFIRKDNVLMRMIRGF
jgi:cytochrome b561